MKVALVHYWLLNMRGGERVLEALCEMYPDADIFTHVYDPANVAPRFQQHRIHTTFINRLPGARRWYQRYLPLMPLALEQLDLREYDLVISSESGPAKGFLVSPHTVHICYCHTPMRYLWDMYHDYLAQAGRLTRIAMRPLLHYLRMWDVLSSFRVDHFVANSHFVAQRVAKHYRREADVIHPPVSVEDFQIMDGGGDFYLMVGQLVGYKRTEIAVHAFNQMGRRLVIIGDGDQLASLRRLAGPTVHLLGRQPFSVIREHYAKCRALIFPGIEDFGIVPVEAMASGRPVIAYRKGGALESVVEGETGLFFDDQNASSLIDAVERFEQIHAQFIPQKIRRHAEKFHVARFKREMQSIIERLTQSPARISSAQPERV